MNRDGPRSRSGSPWQMGILGYTPSLAEDEGAATMKKLARQARHQSGAARDKERQAEWSHALMVAGVELDPNQGRFSLDAKGHQDFPHGAPMSVRGGTLLRRRGSLVEQASRHHTRCGVFWPR